MNGGVLSAKAVFQLLALQAPRVSHMLVKIPGANFQKEWLKKAPKNVLNSISYSKHSLYKVVLKTPITLEI